MYFLLKYHTSRILTDSALLWYDIDMQSGKCFYCDKDAAYFDVIMDDEDYIIADVCIDHLKMGLSS